MRKTDFSLCENKDADQLCSNCTADQYFVFAAWILQFLLYGKFQDFNFIPRLYWPVCVTPGPEVIKLFSSSAQLSMKFQLLINTEITQIF